MAKVYQDTSGKTYASQAEAAAGNTKLGTNPSTGGGGSSTNTSSALDTNYTFNVGKESVSDYNSRIAEYNSLKHVNDPIESTNNKYVSDSSSVVNGENDTMNQLQSLFNQSGDVDNLMKQSKQSISEIDGFWKLLEERQQKEVAGINATYDADKLEHEHAQANETGSNQSTITSRLGGYLGASGSAVGFMNNLAQTHRTEMLQLAAKRDAAIQAARNAILDKQFALARMKADEIRKTTEDLYQRHQDFFNNALKLSAENRAQEDQQVDHIKDLLEGIGTVAESGVDVEIDAKKASQIDSYYGVPGFTAAYADAKNQAAQIKNRDDKMASMQKYVDLIESVPAGMKIPIGDEMVTGIGKVSDISTYQVEDKNGNVRIVNFNKGNGQYSVTNVGRIGTPSSSSDTASDPDKQAALSATMQALSQGKDKNGKAVMNADGTISASAYLQVVAAMEKKYPGTSKYVNDQFLNPSLSENRYFDDEDLVYLRQKAGIGVGYGSVGSGQ